ncbi:MAG TPA: GNAT family N-acetyltransferase [Caulifigura sp.]|jgi:RimJ/RimL family protein N-acetyltransferase|nr:GNAT family N-acetyltransferase [Caulifigura sp.]
MSNLYELKTERLILRPWRPSDRDAFAALNSDPRVMEFFPALLSREESDAGVDRVNAHFAEHGYGWWAVEVPGEAEFIGFIGLWHPNIDVHFTPCVEIGWRLAYDYWGRGYAPEGARAALEFGFGTLGLSEIVSYTATVNLRSRRVMEKIGMMRDEQGDFDHPRVPEGHLLRRHVLYRKRRGE